MFFVDDNRTPETNSSKNVPNKRVIHTKFGYDINLERRDPYGLVFVAWHKGPPPAELQGAYSDWDQARRAVEIYLNKETFNKIVDEPVSFEKAKVKQRG